MVVRPVLCRRFIGRAAELEYLDERRREAAKSRGSLVLVAGEAGIGKSRLLSEFCGSLAGSRWRIGYGSCLEHVQRPYGPILDLLARFETAKRVTIAPEATKDEQLSALVDRLADAASHSGIIAVIEDLHWADSATLELLSILAGKVDKLRMLVVGTYRPNEMPADHPSHAALARLERAARSGRIDLVAFEDSELRSFIDEALRGYRLPDETRRAIAGTSDGNPFFAEELLKVAVERTIAREPRDAAAEALPFSVRATLLERWHRLDENDRAVIAQAAVIGRNFDVDLLVATLDESEERVLLALRRARDVQLINEVGTSFLFRHALTRDAIYSAFLAAQVAPLHRKIALALEAAPEKSGALEGLAYHWWAASDDERAARYNRQAGDAAASVHAHEDAVAFYRRALESPLLAHAERAAIHEKLADRYMALASTERVHEATDAAADAYLAAGDFEEEARCRSRAAIIAYALDRPDPTSTLRSLLERLPPDAYLPRSRVEIGLAWVTASLGFPTQSSAHLANVDARAVAERPDIALRYHNIAAWNAMSFGDLATFLPEYAAWTDAARTAPFGVLGSAYTNGAFCHSLFGLHDAAAALIAASIDVSRRERNLLQEESAYAFSVGCCVLRGDLEGARRALAHVSPTTDNAVTLTQAAAYGIIAAIHLDDEALMNRWYDAVARESLDAVDEICAAGVAEVLVRRGRAVEAASVLRGIIFETERARGDVFTFLAAARWGPRDETARLRARLAAAAVAPEEILETHALSLFDAYVARREGRHADAIEPARAAALGFGRLHFPLLEARAYEAAGELDAALALYERCGAVSDVRRLERVPRAVAPAVRPARLSRPELSEREREIAVLVAKGSSNKAIAERLEISAKTVEKHLGAVYRKLGFSSRTRLAVYVSGEAEVTT